MKKNIIIFGGPGSGKGTQSELLIQKYGLHHISTGELLRDHIARGTKIGKVTDVFISNGHLIPDELMIEILADTLKNNEEKTANGVIFDGFPRTIAQAQALVALLKEFNTDILAVIGLDVNDDELVRRMLERAKTSGRADDNLETIKKRLEVYHRQTAPLREFYINQGQYHNIDGNGSVEDIAAQIANTIDALSADDK